MPPTPCRPPGCTAACTSSLCLPPHSTPSCAPASPATPVSWSWKALGSVRSSAQEPSPIHSCSTTSHSFIGLAPGRFDYIGEGTPGPAREEAGADAFPEHRMNWATATSYSTSVQCWAPTSSWRQCWLIWDHAEPGWPHRNLLWAWQAQWPHWSWLQLGTYSLLLLSQPPCFGPPVHALCCRVAHWRGVPRPNNSEAPSLTLSWRGQRPGPSADEEPRFGPNQVGTHLSLEPTGAEERGHRREGREEEGCLGGLAECERDREGALDGSGRSAEGLRGEMHACPG
ncbi:membrane progestin receptor delta isoform X11 [Pan paniscus]|uniref:membrane progestin receptor delta isoform X11 n=1 Tax=Pan paniscus TaxID=9597 RepID=UPI0004F0022E